jgi:tetratricopeptide (TPR) repeat protein
VCLTTIAIESEQNLVLAATEFVNPLEKVQRDPILPVSSLHRTLTSLEKERVREIVIQLDKEARTELAAGNKEKAFQIWYRELRLQRALSRTEEIAALARVGEIAWLNTFSQDLRFITERLVNIENEVTAKQTLTPKILNSLGKAYQQMRDVDKAIAIYQKILTNARKQDDIEGEKLNLEILGKLYLAKFDYLQAGITYEELLKLVPDNAQENYLNQLVEIYDRQNKTLKAISVKNQLAKHYQKNQQLEKLAALKISLAQDYQNTQQPTKASQNYQEAYNLAKSLQQLALAEDALQKLAQLQSDLAPRDLAKPARASLKMALQTYQELLKVQQKSYNSYGSMNTYERIGNIYSKQGNYNQALAAFQQGLIIAKSLNYRVDYFTNKINQINQLISH